MIIHKLYSGEFKPFVAPTPLWPIGDLSQPIIGIDFVCNADIRHCSLAIDPQ
jgi:hypothetical protein